VAILAMLTKVRIPKDRIERAVRRTDRGFRDGLSYVRSAHDLRNILIFAAFFFMFAWQYDVTLPLLARKTFHGGPTTFAVLSSAIGLGAIVSLFARRLVRTSGDRKMLGSAAVYGVATTGAALSTNVATMAVALFMAGLSITVMITAISARLQLRTRPDMRGRVIALWTVAVLGTRPIGAPLSGALAAWSGPRWALAIGALTPLGLWLALRGRPARPIELPVDSAVSDTELIEVAEEAGFVETVSEAADPLLPLIDPVPERAGPAQT
jgi:MFS family permease